MRECELDHNCNPIPAVATGVSNPFTFFNTCHSPAFFYLESNICRERSIYNVHPPYHLSHSTPDSESNRRTAGGLTVSIRTIREQDSQLTGQQTFPGLSVLFSILSELTINPFEDPHLFLTDCQGLEYGWYRWTIMSTASSKKPASSNMDDEPQQERGVSKFRLISLCQNTAPSKRATIRVISVKRCVCV